MKILPFDVEEIAAELCGISDESREDSANLELAIYEKYGCDLGQFESLIKDLGIRLDMGISPVTNEVYHGFSNKENNQWICKENITSKFINTLIHWMTEGETMPPGHKGFKRDITNKGKIEFIMTISPASAQKAVENIETNFEEVGKDENN